MGETVTRDSVRSDETPQRWRTKPAIVQVMRFTTNNEIGSPAMDRIVNWVNQGQDEMRAWHNGTDIFINGVRGQVGDYIIRDVNFEFHLCKADAFEATYESE